MLERARHADGLMGVCAYRLCFVEERLHALLEVFSLLAGPHRAGQTTTGSGKKAHALHVPVDHGVRALANRDLHRRRRPSGGHDKLCGGGQEVVRRRCPTGDSLKLGTYAHVSL